MIALAPLPWEDPPEAPVVEPRRRAVAVRIVEPSSLKFTLMDDGALMIARTSTNVSVDSSFTAAERHALRDFLNEVHRDDA